MSERIQMFHPQMNPPPQVNYISPPFVPHILHHVQGRQLNLVPQQQGVRHPTLPPSSLTSAPPQHQELAELDPMQQGISCLHEFNPLTCFRAIFNYAFGQNKIALLFYIGTTLMAIGFGIACYIFSYKIDSVLCFVNIGSNVGALTGSALGIFVLQMFMQMGCNLDVPQMPCQTFIRTCIYATTQLSAFCTGIVLPW